MIKKSIFLTILILNLVVYSFANDSKGEEIIGKTYELKESLDDYSQVTMVLLDKQGNKKTRKFTMATKEKDKERNTFIEFIAPADVQGTRFLTLGNKNGEDEQRIFFPALGKVRRISSSGRDGKFMGSDLYYYDMEDNDFSDFSYNYLKDGIFMGMDCHLVESIPKDKNAPYSRTILWVNKQDNFVYKRDCYDKKKKQLQIKSIMVLEVKTMNGVIMGTKMVVENYAEDHKTLLQRDNIKINIGVDDKIFSVQNLAR